MSGIVYVEGCDWENFRILMDKSGEEACKLADETLAIIGAEGRAIAAEKEGVAFRMGKPKFKNGKWAIRSKYDEKLKGWKSISRNMRLMGFKFEKAAYKRGMTRRKALNMVKASSYGTFSSNVANLWDRPTKPYSKRSPLVGNEEGIRTWGKDAVRDPRPVYDSSDVDAGLSKAMPRADASLELRLKKLGWR